MKKYLKHFIAVAVCLVLGVSLFAGCTENLGTELTAEADITTAKTYVVESLDSTNDYEEGFQASFTVSGTMNMDSTKVKLNMDAKIASNGEKANQKTNVSMTMSSKNMESTSKMNTDVNWGKVGENYVKYDKTAEQQYTFEDESEMLSNLPVVQEATTSVAFIGMIFGADMTILADLDFDAFDENEDISYKLYKSGDDYNLVIKTTTVEDGVKAEAEIKILTAGGKVKSIELNSNLFNDTRAEGASEAVWTDAGSCVMKLVISYEFKDFSLLSANQFADFEVVDDAYEIGSMDEMPF